MDGALIGAAALVSVPVAVSTVIAVLAHEIPHELGDFAILLNAGYSRTRALVLNGLSESAGLVVRSRPWCACVSIPDAGTHCLTFASAQLRLRRDGRPDSGNASWLHSHRGAMASTLVAAGVLTVAVF